jgi:hypothetical protein
MTNSFCTQCGAPLRPDARFCGQCGAPLSQPTAMPPAPPTQQALPQDWTPPPSRLQPAAWAAPPVPQEPIVGMLAGLQRSGGFLGMKKDTFNLLVTPTRLVFAAVTQQMMKDAVATANAEAKAQGKGFFKRVAAQMRWMDVICQQYEGMPVDAILAQFPGSYAIANGQIQRIRFHESFADEDHEATRQMVIATTGGKQRFDLQTGVREAKNLLKQTLPHLVR